MSTALDLAALAAQGELKIPIARGVVSQGGSGTDYTGWSGVSSVFVEAKVEVRDQSRGFATLTLTVEGSTNGSDWSTLETFTFGHGGTQTATVSSPDDHLRVSWAVGGHSEWQIIEVTAAPSIIDTGSGGGSQPVPAAARTLSGHAFDATGLSYVLLSPEGGITDYLDTINGGTDGQTLILECATPFSTGGSVLNEIRSGGNITFTNQELSIVPFGLTEVLVTAVYSAAHGVWVVQALHKSTLVADGDDSSSVFVSPGAFLVQVAGVNTLTSTASMNDVAVPIGYRLIAEPASPPAYIGWLVYADQADGALKAKNSDGTVRTLAVT